MCVCVCVHVCVRACVCVYMCLSVCLSLGCGKQVAKISMFDLSQKAEKQLEAKVSVTANVMAACKTPTMISASWYSCLWLGCSPLYTLVAYIEGSRLSCCEPPYGEANMARS